MVRRIKDRTRARFHVALSEVGAQNAWQRAVLGFAMVGTERDRVAVRVGDVVSFVEAMGLASVAGDEREILRYGASDLGGDRLDAGHGAELEEDPDPDGPDADWIPESWKHEGSSDPEVR